MPTNRGVFYYARQVTFSLLTISLVSCGMVQKMAVKTTSDMLFDAAKEIETEANWEIFKDGVPGNLKMMEGMLYVEPGNRKLLVGLSKGYTGYAFAVSETQYLPDLLKEKESPYRAQLLANYTKGLNFGLRFLEESGIKFDDLKKMMSEDGGIIRLLDKELDDTRLDKEGVIFTAQSMGSLILLQKDEMALVALLPIVKGLFDWVCLKDPNINYGACDMFQAAYEAGRPKMLGGNPEKGKAMFKQLFQKHPHNWLARIAYIRFYVIPMSEEDEFKKEMAFLESMREKYLAQIPWKGGNEQVEPEFANKALYLYQTIAIKQYEMIKTAAKGLF